VLNAYDIYPSVTAAGEANPELSTLLGALAQVSAALNISVINQIENTPGTLAAPTNEVSGSPAADSSNWLYCKLTCCQ
jgi:hypothetical protein